MLVRFALILCLAAIGLPASAQQNETPYWVSLKADRANMRVGPSENFPVEWVFVREGLPLKVLRVNQGWRYIEDPDGERGWIFAAMLTRSRTAIVSANEKIAIRAEPAAGSALRWHAEPGVVGKLGECEAGWCEFDVDGRKGWAQQTQLWGAGDLAGD